MSLELIKVILAVDSFASHTCPLTKEIVLHKSIWPNGSDLDLSPGENLFIDSIDFDKSKNQAFAKFHLGPKSKTVSIKIDSCSQVNILTRSIFQSLGIKCPLKKTPKRLTAYDAGNLKVDVYIRLDYTYNDKTISEEFNVVETNSTPILGLNACVSLELIKLILAVDSRHITHLSIDQRNCT